jgi:hypothetical protein
MAKLKALKTDLFSCNAFTRCCYITADSAITALQTGACKYRCISKQMQHKTPFSHNGYMKSLEIYENFINLFCLEKKTFLQYYTNSEPFMAYYPK